MIFDKRKKERTMIELNREPTIRCLCKGRIYSKIKCRCEELIKMWYRNNYNKVNNKKGNFATISFDKIAGVNKSSMNYMNIRSL